MKNDVNDAEMKRLFELAKSLGTELHKSAMFRGFQLAWENNVN